MKYNYPVKYAVMPIIEQVGWSHGLNELEREYDAVCYIVSKCYLLGDKTKYKENGKTEKEYQVVFPYQKGINYNWEWERINPTINNSTNVEKVFDNYDEALEFATQKNEELCNKACRYLSHTKVSEKIQNFNDKLSEYKMLEQQILLNTSNLEISNIKELNNLIIYDKKDKIKTISCNLYEYLNCPISLKFIVYSISQEKYNEILKLVNNQNLSDVSNKFKNAEPILYHNSLSDDKNNMIINKNGDVLYYINKWDVLIDNDKQELPPVDLNNIDDETEHLFTTETLKDIMVSFIQNKYINTNDIQGPVLKKTLSNKKK